MLYGISLGSLSVVNQKTGAATKVRNIQSGETLNAADVGTRRHALRRGSSTLLSVDPATGAVTRVMSFPGGTSSSGDLAFVGDRLVGSAATSGSDELVEFDLAARRSKLIGAIGFSCVWGLAAYGTTLYGLTCSGEILAIDTSNGRGTLVAKSNVGFWGASAR